MWLHASIPPKRKLVIYRASVLQTLTYALATHVLSPADLHRIAAFHVGCSRKILIPTTFAATKKLNVHALTNADVLRKANELPRSVDIEHLRIKLHAQFQLAIGDFSVFFGPAMLLTKTLGKAVIAKAVKVAFGPVFE